MAEMTSYIGIPAKKAKPTKQHRPAIWECMLGTVYAQNDEGEIKYFDYAYEAAKLFAGVRTTAGDPTVADRDLRVWRNPENPNRYWHPQGEMYPQYKQKVLYIRKV